LELAGGVELREVFEDIARVGRDELGVGGAVEPRVFLLEHVAAGRARHDDLTPVADGRRQARDVVADERLGLVDRAAVEVGHTAAPLGRQADVDPVLLDHVHRGAARRRLVVLDAARGEQRDLAARGAPRRRQGPSPRGRASGDS